MRGFFEHTAAKASDKVEYPRYGGQLRLSGSSSALGRSSPAPLGSHRHVGFYAVFARLCNWSMNLLIDAFISAFGPEIILVAIGVFIYAVVQYVRD